MTSGRNRPGLEGRSRKNRMGSFDGRGVRVGRFYCGSLAITLISKSKPDSQVTPIAVTVG
ncbi:hypothetical protein D3C73_1138910 [compost metagenome]